MLCFAGFCVDPVLADKASLSRQLDPRVHWSLPLHTCAHLNGPTQARMRAGVSFPVNRYMSTRLSP